ncbi:DUF397 domain-containing protein [Streptomyces sp. JJ66]|uniref:DUF397 domain-containing protein n=1 Tax=Streptomyces sp. JJ66 TaxID=2803843 RepID=UPI001C579CE0|nr:DUF397 domain-containing protein [Streptomyces sp. JJ66]MBW1604403.1 DUF397 domain-containing protein [Streptomyces sp. JJ66]
MKSKQDLHSAEWRKSSYSDGSGGNCVEMADNLPGVVPVRDSKVSSGPALVFGVTGWTTFVTAVKQDAFRPF